MPWFIAFYCPTKAEPGISPICRPNRAPEHFPAQNTGELKYNITFYVSKPMTEINSAYWNSHQQTLITLLHESAFLC